MTHSPGNVTRNVKLPLSSCVGLMMMLLLPIVGAAQANYTKRATDGATPLELSPGAPAGSYALSGFDNINPYNQSISFILPLISIGGRGSSSYTMQLPIEQKWRIDHNVYDPRIGCGERCEEYIVEHHYQPNPNWYTSIKPGFSPGALVRRSTGSRVIANSGCGSAMYQYTLTRLTFIAADGTEYELRDKLRGGQPLQPISCTQGASRGQVFTTADGSSATFVADAPITDHPTLLDDPDGVTFVTSGYLFLRDGTRYRIDDEGHVTEMRDKNGNLLRFFYEGSLTKVVDSLNREIRINGNTITYQGFGGAERSIQIIYNSLSTRLRPANAQHPASTLKTYAELFPSLPIDTSTEGFMNSQFDSWVVAAVVLPNNRQYGFYYNSYGELARVDLPTGGSFEYDYQDTDGVMSLGGDPEGGDNYQILRRVTQRRIYKEGGALESVITFGACSSVTPNLGDTCVQVDQLEPNAANPNACALVDQSNNYRLASRTRHYYYGVPGGGLAKESVYYPKWNEGKEAATELLACDGNTLLRRVVNTWQQRAPVSWWSASIIAYGPEPSNDPRLIETTTTLLDSNQVSKQTFSYDQYNNQTDVFEHDFGVGAPGPLRRHAATRYLTNNPVNGLAYDTPALSATNPSLASIIHLRDLPEQQSVFDAAGVERARVVYEYDKYAGTGHAPLVSRSDISGLAATFTSAFEPRGNPTATTRYLLSAGGSVNGSVTSYQQFDVAGNLVKAIDPRGNSTVYDYSDRFGSPNGEARANNAPPTLAAPPAPATPQQSYAFPTLTTNALNQTAYAQYDYFLGKPVEAEDCNGVIFSGYYNDALDRPTQAVRAVGTTFASQTTFSYDDPNRKVTTTSDQTTFGDNLLKSQTLFDGLGRTIETRQYETTGGNYIAVRQAFDSLGRVSQSSNPFRPWNSESPLYTKFTFDALGRTLAVTTPDEAVVSTAYSGDLALVTDQSGKQRMSRSNALGQLTDVWEITAADNATVPVSFPGQASVTAGYLTHYDYDTLDNLTGTTQRIGANGTTQTRAFAYDSLKRLTSAFNPENGTVLYDYDQNDNPLHRTDARGIVTSYAYDALNRITSRSYSDQPQTPSVSYQYDTPGIAYAKGRLTSVTASLPTADPNKPDIISKTNYAAFDPLGRVTASSQQTNGQTYSMSYEFDLASHLKSEMYPSGRIVEHSFDAAGRITSVNGRKGNSVNTPYATQISYASHGGVASMRLGNTTPNGEQRWQRLTYNNRLQPTEVALGSAPGGSELLKLEYKYGVSVGGSLDTTKNNGNIQSQLITVPGMAAPLTQNYDYDSLNRLRKVTETGSAQTWTQAFVYDDTADGAQGGGRYGNRRIDRSQTTDSLEPVTNPTFDLTTNRINSAGFTFDANGNMTNGDGMAYSFDAENRIVTANSNGTTPDPLPTRYSYDGDGHRIRKLTANGQATTIFVYNALGQLVAEYNNQSPATESQTSYLTPDMLGTPRLITKADGSVKSRHDYLPFGEELFAGTGGRASGGQQKYSSFDDGQGVRQKFTAYERDIETGLDYAQARYYSSKGGRFTSTDPLLASGRPHNPQSWNRYAFVLNNPLKLIDPKGLQDSDPQKTSSHEQQHSGRTATVYSTDSDNRNDADAFRNRAEDLRNGGPTSSYSSGEEIISDLQYLSAEHGPFDTINIIGHAFPPGMLGDSAEFNNNNGLFIDSPDNPAYNRNYTFHPEGGGIDIHPPVYSRYINTRNDVDGRMAKTSDFAQAILKDQIKVAVNGQINFIGCNTDSLASHVSYLLAQGGRPDISVVGASGNVYLGGGPVRMYTGDRGSFNTYRGGQFQGSHGPKFK